MEPLISLNLTLRELKIIIEWSEALMLDDEEQQLQEILYNYMEATNAK